MFCSRDLISPQKNEVNILYIYIIIYIYTYIINRYIYIWYNWRHIASNGGMVHDWKDTEGKCTYQVMKLASKHTLSSAAAANKNINVAQASSVGTGPQWLGMFWILKGTRCLFKLQTVLPIPISPFLVFRKVQVVHPSMKHDILNLPSIPHQQICRKPCRQWKESTQIYIQQRKNESRPAGCLD
jgi:hypothetical protein